jgi:hypothetical protein
MINSLRVNINHVTLSTVLYHHFADFRYLLRGGLARSSESMPRNLSLTSNSFVDYLSKTRNDETVVVIDEFQRLASIGMVHLDVA